MMMRRISVISNRLIYVNNSIILSNGICSSSSNSNSSSRLYSNILKPLYYHNHKYVIQRYFSVVEPASRKKGKKNDGSDYNFEEVAMTALVTIKEAIEPLLVLNPTYMLKAEDKRVVLATGNKGTYSFEINSERETLRVLSPGSGSFSYFYNYEDKTWLNIKDNHDMRGLITRDLLRHCTGLPLFK